MTDDAVRLAGEIPVSPVKLCDPESCVPLAEVRVKVEKLEEDDARHADVHKQLFDRLNAIQWLIITTLITALLGMVAINWQLLQRGR